MGHLFNLFLVHADGDKLFQLALIVQHAHRGILRPGLLAGDFGNALQERFEGIILDQVQAGAVQGGQAFFKLLTSSG